MRIAMVSEHANPLAALGGTDFGGQSVAVAGLALALAERGHEVVVHTRREHPRQPAFVEIVPGVQVHHVTAGPPRAIPKDQLVPYLPQFAQQLTRQWRRNPPEVVHAHFWMSGLVSAQAATPLGLPTALTFHALGVVKRRHLGDADTSPPSRLDAERCLARCTVAILATATDEIHELIEMGADPNAVHLVPCGVDIGHFMPQGPVAPPRTAAHRLVCLGKLVPRKGVDDAVRMLRWLPDTELLIAGGPRSTDLDGDDEVRRLREIAAITGVSNRVVFLGGIGRADVPSLLRSADLAVCLPWYEPFGMVPLEAMACGLPIVGSRVGGLVDTIEDNRTGVLVAPQRPDLAARVVRGLLANPERLRALARRGPERVAQKYSWQQAAARTEAIYAGLIARRRHSSAGSTAARSAVAVMR